MPSDFCNTLLQAFQEGSLERAVVKILNENVPQLCTPKLQPTPDEDFETCINSLFTPFEEFICGGVDSVTAAAQVKEMGVESAFCGHIFKAREPTYSCLDCGMDPTCVLCRDCFLKSPHKNHNYKMHSSIGGGYCDCGDVEAWHSEPWCQHHLKVKQRLSETQTNQDISEEEAEQQRLDSVPADMRSRCEELIGLLLRLSGQLLLWSEEMSLPRPLTLRETVEPDDYTTVLYNDEVHSYDQVIRTLTRVIGCDKQRATMFATIVDRDGRSVLQFSSRTDTSTAASQVKLMSRTNDGIVLECRSMHRDCLAFQNYTIYFMKWLAGMVDRFELLRPVVCRLFFDRPSELGNFEDRNNSFVDKVLMNHTLLWKDARHQSVNCLMGVILKDNYYKKMFAICFVDNYYTIMDNYIRDDHNQSDSLRTVSCQIFTVISLSKMLLAEYNILSHILEYLSNQIRAHTQPVPDPDGMHVLHYPHLSTRTKFDPFERTFECTVDLKYLLLSLASEPDWLEKCDKEARQNFITYFTNLVKMLSFLQDMNAVTRVSDYHVEQEPEISSGFFVTVCLAKVIRLTVQLAATSPSILLETITIAKDAFMNRCHPDGMGCDVPFDVWGWFCSVVYHNVSNQPISIIQPLNRLVSTLCDVYLRKGNFAELPLTSEIHELLMERPLRLMVFISQVNCNFWVRNGVAIQHLVNSMFRPDFRLELIDRDLYTMQQASACLPSVDVIMKMIHKFSLGEYFQKTANSVPDFLKLKVQLSEDFFRQILLIVSERHRVGVGEGITSDDVLEQEILHVLCQRPQAHSELLESLRDGRFEKLEVRVMKVLDQVADKVTIGQKTLFQVKNDRLQEFNRFYYHYKHHERNTAEQWVRKQLKLLNRDCALPPPVPVPFTATYAKIAELLRSSMFVQLIASFLDIVITRPSVLWWSELAVDLVLHLVGVALHEDVRSGKQSDKFPFMDLVSASMGAGTENGLLARLEQLVDRPTHEEQSDLLRWTLKKWHEVRRLRDDVRAKGNQPQRTGSVEVMESEMEVTVIGDEMPSEVTLEKMRRAEAARLRRERVMNKMSSMQKNFISSNAALFAGVTAPQGASGGAESQSMEVDEAPHTSPCPVALGTGRSVRRQKPETIVCILCQEDVSDSPESQVLVMAAHLIRSTVLTRPAPLRAPFPALDEAAGGGTSQNALLGGVSQLMGEMADLVEGVLDDAAAQAEPAGAKRYRLRSRTASSPATSTQVVKTIAAEEEIDRWLDRPVVATLDHPEGSFLEVCGHAMHLACKVKYADELKKKAEHMYRTANDQSRLEFRCPMCQCLSNMEIPILPPPCSVITPETLTSRLAEELPYEKWLDALTKWLGENMGELTGEVKKQSSPPRSVSAQSRPRKTRGSLDSTDSGSTSSATLSTLFSFLQPSLSKIKRAGGAARVPGASGDLPQEKVTALVRMTSLVHILALKEGVQKRDPKTLSFYSDVALRSLRHCLAYTLAMWDKILRNENRSFFDGLPERYEGGLSCLIRSCLYTHNQPLSRAVETTRRDCLQLLSSFLPPLNSEHTSRQGPSILEVDFFFLLVSLCLLRSVHFSDSTLLTFMTNTLPIGDAVEANLLRLCYAGHVVQVMLAARTEELVNVRWTEALTDSGEMTLVETEEVLELYQQLRLAAGMNEDQVPSPRSLARYLRDALLPFLRCSAFFFSHITSVEPPTELRGTQAGAPRVNPDREVVLLCKYLNLPMNICDLLERSGETQKQLFAWWCVDSRIEASLARARSDPLYAPLSHPVPVPRLVELPKDITDLMAAAVDYKCVGKDNTIYPALCLVCGEFCCYQGYCCRQLEVGGVSVFGAQVHARKKHAGYTVMLRLGTCKVVVYSDNAKRVTQVEAPYKDRYGETDPGLRRGNPLYLDQDAYHRLTQYWLQHFYASSSASPIYHQNLWFD